MFIICTQVWIDRQIDRFKLEPEMEGICTVIHRFKFMIDRQMDRYMDRYRFKLEPEMEGICTVIHRFKFMIDRQMDRYI